MKKLKIFASMLLSLIIMTVAVKYFMPPSRTQAASHLALKVILNQTKDLTISESSINIEETYPSDYKLNLTSNYYNVSIIGVGGQTLFTGKVPNKDVIIVEGAAPIEQPLSSITMYLPYFEYAQMIKVTDENNVEKLSFSLKDLALTPPKQETNLSGNGICDETENIFSNYKDCKWYLERFFKK